MMSLTGNWVGLFVLGLVWVSTADAAFTDLREHLNKGIAGAKGRPVGDITFKQELDEVLKDPTRILTREGGAFIERLKSQRGDIADKLDALVASYHMLEAAFRAFVDANVKGKTAEQLSRETLAELRKRSQEIRDLEGSLRLLLAGEDLESLVREFIRNPSLLLREEADKLLKRLREKHGEKVSQMERLVESYRRHAQEIEKQVRERTMGKSAEEIAQMVADEVRKHSEPMRQLEKRAVEVLKDIEGIKQVVEQEIKDRDLGNKARNLEKDANEARRQLEREADEAKKRIEREILKLLQLGHRR